MTTVKTVTPGYRALEENDFTQPGKDIVKTKIPDKIYIIRDNARYYTAQIVKDFLKNSNIEFIPLPSYSPNLNLIE